MLKWTVIMMGRLQRHIIPLSCHNAKDCVHVWNGWNMLECLDAVWMLYHAVSMLSKLSRWYRTSTDSACEVNPKAPCAFALQNGTVRSGHFWAKPAAPFRYI